MRRTQRDAVLLGIVGACLVGAFLNLNFYLASGDPLPFFIAKEPFDEGIGLDLILPLLELIIAGTALWTYLSLRRSTGALGDERGCLTGRGRWRTARFRRVVAHTANTRWSVVAAPSTSLVHVD